MQLTRAQLTWAIPMTAVSWFLMHWLAFKQLRWVFFTLTNTQDIDTFHQLSCLKVTFTSCTFLVVLKEQKPCAWRKPAIGISSQNNGPGPHSTSAEPAERDMSSACGINSHNYLWFSRFQETPSCFGSPCDWQPAEECMRPQHLFGGGSTTQLQSSSWPMHAMPAKTTNRKHWIPPCADGKIETKASKTVNIQWNKQMIRGTIGYTKSLIDKKKKAHKYTKNEQNYMTGSATKSREMKTAAQDSRITLLDMVKATKTYGCLAMSWANDLNESHFPINPVGTWPVETEYDIETLSSYLVTAMVMLGRLHVEWQDLRNALITPTVQADLPVSKLQIAPGKGERWDRATQTNVRITSGKHQQRRTLIWTCTSLWGLVSL